MSDAWVLCGERHHVREKKKEMGEEEGADKRRVVEKEGGGGWIAAFHLRVPVSTHKCGNKHEQKLTNRDHIPPWRDKGINNCRRNRNEAKLVMHTSFFFSIFGRGLRCLRAPEILNCCAVLSWDPPQTFGRFY